MNFIFYINMILVVLLWLTSWYILSEALQYVIRIFKLKSITLFYLIIFIITIFLLYLINGDDYINIIQSTGL